MATTYNQANDPNFQGGESSVCRNGYAATPSNTVDEVLYPKQAVAAGAGTLVVLPLKAPDDGNHLITFTSVLAGYVIPFRIRRVNATGTTASVFCLFD
jgi:hypothetical protein